MVPRDAGHSASELLACRREPLVTVEKLWSLRYLMVRVSRGSSCRTDIHALGAPRASYVEQMSKSQFPYSSPQAPLGVRDPRSLAS